MSTFFQIGKIGNQRRAGHEKISKSVPHHIEPPDDRPPVHLEQPFTDRHFNKRSNRVRIQADVTGLKTLTLAAGPDGDKGVAASFCEGIFKIVHKEPFLREGICKPRSGQPPSTAGSGCLNLNAFWRNLHPRRRWRNMMQPWPGQVYWKVKRN